MNDSADIARGLSCSSLRRSERVDRACNLYEDAWRAGGRPDIGEFLAGVNPAEQSELLRELLLLNLHYRRKLGETPTLEDYQGTYPAVDFGPFAELFTAAAQPAAPSFDKQAIQSTPFNSRATTSDAPLLGRLNDYELLEEIGRGGMGVVFKARQVRLDRTVAVKMVLAGGFATSTERERFHCEARAAALLDHPNILPVYEVGEHEGRQYYSMGYVDGQSLDARLAAGPLPPKEAAELAATLAEAVEYAHGQGVIHRDIKPSNILIDREGRPRVADFGLAKRLGAPGTPGHGSDLTVTGQILGTPSYMAPEQAAGQVEAVAPTADVYALGALLYAMLTGRPPFQAASALETLRQVREREPAALRQLNAAVPRDLETIVLKCLEKPAARRYATARALADDLRRFLGGRPVLARPVRRGERAWRWCRRQPVVAALIVAVALTLMAGIVASSLFAVDSYRLARRAKEAEAAGQRDLVGALMAQARLSGKSHLPGQRFDSLEAIRKARQIEGPSRKLADEAVAALCLPDLAVAKQWRGAPQGLACVAFAPRLDVYARCDVQGNVSVRSVDGDIQFAAWKMDKPVCGYHGLEFSPDGRYVHAETCGGEAGCRLVRLDVSPATTILQDHHAAFAFSPDSRQFVAAYGGNEFRLGELPSGKTLKRFSFPNRNCDVYWNPRKRQMAVVRSAGWRIADLDSGEVQEECLVSRRAMMSTWHPDGRHLAVATENPPGVEIYDTITRRLVARCTGMKEPGVVPTFNHAGDLLETNDWTGIRRLWDPASGSELLRMAANESNSFVFSPDDRNAAVNVVGQDLQTLRITAGAERAFATAMSTGVDNESRDCIVPSPDGRFLAVASAARVSILDARSGFELAVVPDRDLVRFDSAGALLTCGSKGFQRWPIEKVLAGKTFRFRRPEGLYAALPAAGFAADERGSAAKIGRILPDIRESDNFSANGDGTVMALATQTSRAIVAHQAKPGGDVRFSLLGPQNDIRHCAVSAEGKWVATGSFSAGLEPLANARVWDADTAKPVKVLPVGAMVLVCFSPRDRWLSTISGADLECRLWRVGSWEAGPRFPGAIAVAFSPDERILALGRLDGRVQLCETDSGREFAVLPANAAGAPVHPRCFSADGTTLYGKFDGDARFHAWDLRQIRAGLVELGLDQGWPDLPNRQELEADPPSVEVDTAHSEP